MGFSERFGTDKKTNAGEAKPAVEAAKPPNQLIGEYGKKCADNIASLERDIADIRKRIVVVDGKCGREDWLKMLAYEYMVGSREGVRTVGMFPLPSKPGTVMSMSNGDVSITLHEQKDVPVGSPLLERKDVKVVGVSGVGVETQVHTVSVPITMKFTRAEIASAAENMEREIYGAES